jgi:hypothetical protein
MVVVMAVVVVVVAGVAGVAVIVCLFHNWLGRLIVPALSDVVRRPVAVHAKVRVATKP